MQAEVERGLNQALLGNAGVAALVDERVVNEFARKVTWPYVVFMLNAGKDTNQQLREQGDLRYAIKGVTSEQDGGGKTALLIAEALRAALHNQTFTVDAPWKVYRVEHTTIIKYVEQTEHTQIYHTGGIYRIQVSEEFS